MKSYKS